MATLKYFLYFLFNCGIRAAVPGKFWHITDLHWDPEYKVTSNPNSVCPSAGSQPVKNAGRWGHYLCDSPWDLINSSINAMRDILPNPDFILWTGDDTPHVPNENLGQEAVLRIVGNLTRIIQQVFPDTKVYPAIGNHDFHPKSQLPGGRHEMYDKIAQMWNLWLQNDSLSQFKTGAFYTEHLLNTTGQRIIVLNTNLYYDSNQITANDADPANQFQWLESQLALSSSLREKVYLVGHVPPGFFEKKREKPWFRENFNKRYIEIIQKYHTVIAGQFFGHHHTDSFKMFYSTTGSPIGCMFIAPGITPWKTTLPGVENGANNPGIRVFEYDRNTLEILDMVTYYMNLSYANLVAPRWEKEYRLTEAFHIPDGFVKSMQMMLDKISKDKVYLQKYYEYNSVNYDLTECDPLCRADQICAIREIDFSRNKQCLKTESSSCNLAGQLTVILCMLLVFCLQLHN